MSNWASPIVVVPTKSAPGEPLKRRLCIDFKKVNELQQEVPVEGKKRGQILLHPLPKIDARYAKLKGTKVFSTIDLRSRYYHIALGKDSRAKTAFVMPFGKYKFLMVPFGLAQAPAYFQLLMNQVLEGLLFAMTYLDDIIIFSNNEEEHLLHLEEVFHWLRKAGLKIFKSQIHYLGHLISEDGISPLLDKLDSIKNTPVPKCTKEIRQFLGLTGYYRKFVPRLTRKETTFNWTPECQKSFELLKPYLCGEPILKYADTSKPYTLYTDASNYGCTGVLTQSHTTDIDGKSVTTDHPVAFVSGLFRGSQLDWAALMNEVFAIYMSVKKLSFYLDQSQIILRSDHLPLKRFFQKNTLNSKVNNWAMELESFNIKFEYIQGSKNVLADTLSRLIDIDEDTWLPPEEQGYEFGYAVFEDLPKIKTFQVNEVIVGDKEIKNDPDLADTPQCITNPLSMERMKQLQEQDPDIQKLKHKLKHNKLDKEYYNIEDDLLKQKVVDGGHEFWSVYLPCSLLLQVLRAAHNDLGDSGFPRTHAAVKQVFYLKTSKRTLQTFSSVHAAQIEECEVQKEALSSLHVSHGFHLYGFDR